MLSSINLIIAYVVQFVKDYPVLALYLTSVIVDIILGNLKAWYTNDIDSSVGLRGTIKHLGVLAFVVMFLPVLKIYMNTDALALVITGYITGQYIISIIENLGALGMPLPDDITEKLRRLKTQDIIDISHATTVQIEKDKLPYKGEDIQK